MYFVFLLVAHSLLCVVLIGLVLLQQGKGADAGATFGGGGNTVFGAAGATDFITKLTTSLAVGFMLTSILLIRGYQAGGGTVFSSQQSDVLGGSMMEQTAVEKTGEGDMFAGSEQETTTEATSEETEGVESEKADSEAAASGPEVATEAEAPEADAKEAAPVSEGQPAKSD